MLLVFNSKELNAVEETLRNLGLGYIDVCKLIDEDYKELTLEDLGIRKFHDFDGPLGFFRTNSYTTDGVEYLNYELYISDKLIVDIVNLYSNSVKVGFDIVKDIWCKYKVFIEPMIKSFTSKWTKYISDYNADENAKAIGDELKVTAVTLDTVDELFF